MLWSKDTDLKKVILINLKTITCLCTGSTESPIWPQGGVTGWAAQTTNLGGDPEPRRAAGRKFAPLLNDHLPYKPSDDKPAPSSSLRRDTLPLLHCFMVHSLTRFLKLYRLFIAARCYYHTLLHLCNSTTALKLSLDCAGTVLST